jgi:hypothetical protein
VTDTNARPFTGYRELAYTPVPDEFFDWQMQDLGLILRCYLSLEIRSPLVRRGYGQDGNDQIVREAISG